MTTRRVLLGVYLLLLCLSAIVRTVPASVPLAPGQSRLRLPEGHLQAWWETGPADGLPVLLLHGSPGDGTAMHPLSAALPAEWRRLAPDLLGFGGSSYQVPSYSSQAHAAALLAWMDALDLDSAHLVAHSMGGAVALELAAAAPERVRSITMIGAVGVIELELLGNHTLNHAIHGAQLLTIEAARWLVPHFGLLDQIPLNRSYARNFYDTDQRRLRPFLAAYDGPMLFLHGDADFLVPVEAAHEHHRIVPQSELVVLEDDHFFVFRPHDLPPVAGLIADFVHRVASGAPLHKADAAPSRQVSASADVDLDSLTEQGGPARLMTAVLILIATFISEDLTCISAGLMVTQGRLEFGFAALVCAVGLFIGDILLVLIGRWIGPAALRRPPLAWMVTPEAVEHASAWYRSHGARVIFASRVTPGMRLPMYFAAGVLKVPLATTTVLLAIAALLWAPALVGAATLIGEPILTHLDNLQYGSFVLVMLIIAVGGLLRVLPPLMTWRGRRLAQAWLQRILRWEFWPMWMVYPPVIVAACVEAVRCRSLTAFTAANPGIPTSGFVGESKWDIFCRLGGSELPYIPATARLDGPLEVRLARSRAFAADHGYPVVVKPDVGQRGQGVMIVRQDSELAAYMAESWGDLIIQEYVPGAEFGIFYVRHPDEAAGRITSITEKRQVHVTGDGRQSLERLILQSPAALPKAPLHLQVHAHRLTDIPADGEVICLVEVGTHSRGSRFHDGAALRTEALTAAIDRISQRFEGGFFYGRYDIRAPSAEALSRAEGLMVLEVNGVTSEPTHIYDPTHSVWEGWRALITHWQLAYRIGAANMARGAASVTPLMDLLRAVQHFQQETLREHVPVDRPRPNQG